MGQKDTLVKRTSGKHHPAAEAKSTKRKRQRKSNKPPTFVSELPVPRLDEYPVNYCPTCNLCFQAVRENYQKLFNFLKASVPLPEGVCHKCGLEYREMVIDLQSTRKPTVKASDFPL